MSVVVPVLAVKKQPDEIAALLPSRGATDASVERLLLAGLEQGRQAWPTARLGGAEFIQAVLSHVRADTPDLAANVGGLRLHELYLSSACGAGDAGAIAAFEATFFDEIERAFRRVTHDAAFFDDVCQNLREKLFLSRESRRAEILAYGGRGALRRWFRIVVLHHTLNLKQTEGRESLGNDSDIVGVSGDPELAYLKARYATEFKSAADDAATQLTPEERALLSHHYLEGLSIDQIGAIYGAHRVTASRRLNKARARLVGLVRSVLASRFGVGPQELESILRLLPTELSLSLQRVLGARA